jgi:hypothetical protein
MRFRVGALRSGVALGAVALVALTACSSSKGGPSATSSPAASTPSTSTPATPLLPSLHTLTQVASTVPANGDVNPYGIALIRASAGKLVAGDLLISNYNSKANVQGTGTTIMQASPAGQVSQFADVTSLPAGQSCPGGVGLDTALSVLPDGYVVVGSLPQTKAGRLPSLNPIGCLIVLDPNGTPVATWTSPLIDGPWDMTATTTPTGASLYVSNVLARSGAANSAVPVTGTCTIVRIDVSLPTGGAPAMTNATVIGASYPWKVNPPTVVLGPTGVAVASDGTAYVANTLTNTISAIPAAATRTTPVAYGTATLTTGGSLNQPLGLVVAANGNVIAVNGNDGNAVEVTPQGQQIATAKVIDDGAGDLFGIVATEDGTGLWLTNDSTNAVDLYH